MTTATTDVNVTDLDTTLATVRARILAHEITLASLRWFAALTHGDLDKLMAGEEDEDEMPEQEQAPTDILRRLSDQPLLIAATDGKATIPNARTVFTSHIDPDFKNWGADEASSPTPELQTMLYEMARDATFKQMFGSLNREKEHLCMTQSQIIEFVQTHRNQLRTDGYATFFLFKSKGKFFVAGVHLGSNNHLGVDVRQFEDDFVWRAEYRRRLVVPQR